MNLDLTNSDMLDCSPFTGDGYSYLTAFTVGGTTTTKPKPRPTTTKPATTSLGAVTVKPPTTTTIKPTTVRPIVQQIIRNRPSSTYRPRPVVVVTPAVVDAGAPILQDDILASDMNVAPNVTPVGTTTTTTTTTTANPPSGGSMGGGGGASGGGAGGGAEKGKEKDKTADAGATATMGEEITPFYKSYWFWGLLAGGVAGYFYAKNKGKGLVQVGLIGAGIGGAVGFGVEKVMGKKFVGTTTTTSTGATTTTGEVPAESSDAPAE